MTPLRHICAALLIALPTLTSAGSQLIRLTDRDDLFGWEAVGRVEIATNGYCTGTLIAPDLVLTAAHCVYDKRGTAVPASDLRFRAGLRDGQFISQAQVTQVAAHRAYRANGPMDARNIRHDVALLHLKSPIPSAIASPFVLSRAYGKGQRVSVVSYGQGRDNALSWQRDCGVIDAGQNLLAFDCDVTFGSSGAPVFVREGGRARILSLISGGATAQGRQVSYGMTLPQMVDRLKRDLRARPVAQTNTTRIQAKRIRVGQDSGQDSGLGGGLGGGATGAKFAKP